LSIAYFCGTASTGLFLLYHKDHLKTNSLALWEALQPIHSLGAMRFSSSLFAGVAALFSVGVIAFDTSCSTLEPHPIGIDFGVNTV